MRCCACTGDSTTGDSARRIEARHIRRGGERILRLLAGKYSEQATPMSTADQVRTFRVEPVVISMLEDSLGFGHTDLVTC